MTNPTTLSQAHGLAALALCESLLLALKEREIISDRDLRGILTDVLTAHTEASTVSETPEVHHAVIQIVQGIARSIDPHLVVDLLASDDLAADRRPPTRAQAAGARAQQRPTRRRNSGLANSRAPRNP